MPSQDYPKCYYAHKIWGSVSLYSGIFLVVLAVILFATGLVSGGLKSLVVGLYLALFGQANRKPRLIVSEESVTVIPNVFGKPRAFPLTTVKGVVADKKFQILLTNGAVVRLPKLEFSKRTREQFLHDIQRSMSQPQVSPDLNKQNEQDRQDQLLKKVAADYERCRKIESMIDQDSLPASVARGFRLPEDFSAYKKNPVPYLPEPWWWIPADEVENYKQWLEKNYPYRIVIPFASRAATSDDLAVFVISSQKPNEPPGTVLMIHYHTKPGWEINPHRIFLSFTVWLKATIREEAETETVV